MGRPSDLRFERLYDAREQRDPFYLVGQMMVSAPIKYARCTVCVGRPHHPVSFVSWGRPLVGRYNTGRAAS